MAEQKTRREFLGTSAAVSAGLVGSMALQSSVYAAGTDDTIRVGLVGCGGRGTGAATQALSTEGNVKLVAMADAFADSLESSRKRIAASQKDRVAVDEENRFVGLDAYKQLIDNADVDLVILATPPGFRPAQYEYAVSKGKNVFTEKPVAIDAAGVRKFLAATAEAKKKNLKVGVGLQRHHQNTYNETVKRIKDGEIGDVIALRVYWNSGGVWDPRKNRNQVSGELEYQMRNWYYYNWLCGDHIVEQHIHNLDVGCWVKGSYPVKCNGMGGRQVRTDKKYGEIFDHHAVEYEFADGTRMFSQCRHIRNVFNSVSEHAHGSKGSANISGSQITNSDGNVWKYDGKKNNPYQTEHDDLFAAIRNNVPYNEGEYGAHSTMTAIMGRMATYSGKQLTWEQALNSDKEIFPYKAHDSMTWDYVPENAPNADGVYAVPIPGVTDVL